LVACSPTYLKVEGLNLHCTYKCIIWVLLNLILNFEFNKVFGFHMGLVTQDL
jgi:hypothetical protein